MFSPGAATFIALRYLRPKRSFISIITLISVLGVMLGVGVLMVVMSVFKGWQVEFRQLLLGFEPHVQLVPYAAPASSEAPEKMTNWRQLLTWARAQPEVVSATPVAQGMVALRVGNSDPLAVEIFGLKADAEDAFQVKLKKHLIAGELKLGDDDIVLTDRLAKKLRLKVGDVLSALAEDSINQMVRDLRAVEEETDAEKASQARDEITILPKELTVVGLMRADTAGERCYLSLNTAQELFNLEDQVSHLSLEIRQPDGVELLASRWSAQLPPEWGAQTWMDRQGYQLQLVESQKSMLYFLLIFIMLVAAFCVMNTTITVTVQKRREIGILAALGAQRRQIVRLFLVQAVVVAVAGVMLGLLSGGAVLMYRNELRSLLAEWTGRDFFPQDIYFLSQIPAAVQGSDLLSIGSVALVLCLLAAFIPAWFAARVDPAIALRDL
jgi:lipoprotein-releasing system permease protein